MKGAPAPLEETLFAYSRTGLSLHVGDFYDETKARSNLLGRLGEWLESENTDAPMMRNIYAPTSWSGLSALASRLLSQRWTSGPHSLRKLCIPVVTEGRRRAQFSHSQILSLLRSFSHGAPYPERVLPLGPGENPGKVLLDIRRRFAEEPAFIVFLGFGERRNGVYETMRVMRDDHTVSSLIPSLLTPPTRGHNSALNMATWRRNRILLLSNEDITNPASSRHELSAYYPPLGRYREVQLSHPVAERLPAAPDGKQDIILESHNYNNIELIRTWRSKQDCFLAHQTSENVFRTLDTLLSLHRHLTPNSEFDQLASDLLIQLQAKYEATDIDNEGAACLLVCVDQLLEVLAQHRPLWALSLKMIAETPGGLQVDTLQRLLLTFADTADGSLNKEVMACLPPDLPPSQRRRAAIDEMQSMLATLSTMLSIGRAQDFPAHDPLPVAPATGSPPVYPPNASAGHAIEFTLPDVRDEVVRQLYSSDDERKLAQVINLLLAEEIVAPAHIGDRPI